jgi:chromosome segregation ATPase
LISRNAKLDEQLRRSESGEAEKDALREQNAELSLRLSELEEDRREAANNAELARALKNAQTDLQRLSRANDQLNAQLRNADTLQALVNAKDAEIARLQTLAESHAAALERLRRKPDIDGVVGRIEAALGRFEVAPSSPRRSDSIAVRLEAALTLIYQISEVFEEQKRSLLRIAGSLPKRSPGSPGSPR